MEHRTKFFATRITLLALLVVLVFVSKASASSGLAQYSADLVFRCLARESMPICDADPVCRGRFYMDMFAPPLKTQLFEYLLDLYIKENGIQAPLVLVQIMPLNLSSNFEQAPTSIADTPSPQIPFNLKNIFYNNSTSLSSTDSSFLVNCSQILYELLLQSSNSANPSPLLLLLNFNEASGCGVEENCTATPHLPGALQATILGRGLTWWLQSLRLADFCTENEYYMIGEGCQCKSGKQCHEVNPGNYLLPKVSFLIAAIALTVLILYGCYTISNEASEGIRQLVGVIAALLARANEGSM